MKNTLNIFIALVLIFGAYAISAQDEDHSSEEAKMEIFDFNTMEQNTTPSGVNVRPVFVDDIRLVQVTIEEGQTTPSHSHGFVQMVMVQTGKIKAFNDDKEFILGPGQGFAVEADVHHYYTALEDSVTVEVIGPGAPTGMGGGGMGGDGGMGGAGMGGAGGMGGNAGP